MLLTGGAVLGAVAAPATARPVLPGDAARTYVEARAAAISGDHDRSTELLAALVRSDPGDTTLARRALAEAINSGDLRVAVELARTIPAAELSVDGRLLLIADALKRDRFGDAMTIIRAPAEEGNIGFLEPLVRAWGHADANDLRGALAALDAMPANAVGAAFRDEFRAAILLKFRQPAAAEPAARRAIGSAGRRQTRMRVALADAFLAAGDRDRAAAMVAGIDASAADAAARIRAGKRVDQAVDSPEEALGEVILALASDLSRINSRALPVGLAQVARFAAPENQGAAVLLGLLLEAQDRPDAALEVLSSVPESDSLHAESLDSRTRILVDSNRADQALALARGRVSERDAGYADWARLGEVLRETERFGESAEAYGRAIALAGADGLNSELWPLYLLRATALEEADRWPEARQALEAGLALAPEQPLLLNFLGYAKLERGEDLDSAEAMIRKAVELAPEDASITDSLGWALYKRGKLDDAVATLQQAAARDPSQWEIHEHLGDALYASGRRYEARFAWNAALITAEEDVAARIRAKLAAGLSPATAAP